MKKWIKYVIRCLQWLWRNTKVIIGKQNEEKRMQYDLVKRSHSLEKGFCLKNVKDGFGIEKVKEILHELKKYIDKNYDISADGFQICIGILKYYFDKWKELKNTSIIELQQEYEKLMLDNNIILNPKYYGGVEERQKEVNQTEQFENLKMILEKRDSVRNFAKGKIDICKIEEAIELAQTAPSACNRQPARVYIVEKEQYSLIKKWVQGVGGFQEDVDKWLVVTSDEAAFDEGELGQYIVSGSIFAGYLALIIRTMGFATCMVQRNILHTPRYVRNALGMSESEQSICVIAVGNMQEQYVVPKACRYSYTNIVKKV